MAFPESKLDEIRARLPGSVVVGKKIKLKRQGREWIGLCCFHPDKKPSLSVNDAKGIFKCFPCGAGGDIFAFAQKAYGWTFREAVENLAKEAGVELPAKDPDAIKREARRLTIIEVLNECQLFFREAYAGSGAAHAYIRGRGISAATVEAFGIGFAPDDRAALKQHLAGRGIDHEGMAAAGLLVTGDDIPVSYDRFRQRITVPIRDGAGRIVSFGGRDISGRGTGVAKYLNGPETEAFHKGSILYNADRAKPRAHETGLLVVTEGYFDAIAADLAELPAVASCGTSLTEGHLLSAWRMSDTPVMCFDGDAAGQRAAGKAILTAFPLLLPGRSLKFATLPAGYDPDKIVRERGAEALRSVVDASLGLSDTWWRVNLKSASPGTVEGRAALEAAVLEPFKAIPDYRLRRKYEDDAKDRIYRLGPSRSKMIVRANGHSLHSTSPGNIRLSHGLETAAFSLKEAVILATLVKHPEAYDPERVDEKLTDHAQQVVNEIIHLVSSVPAEELDAALTASPLVRDAVEKARAICLGAGIRSLEPK